MLIPILIIIYIIILWVLIKQNSNDRIQLAFIIAPLAPCFVGAAFQGHILWVIVAAPFSYLFALSGVPFYFIFRRFGWLKFYAIVPLSSLLGGIIGYTMINSTLNAFTMTSIYGALTGLIFWYVAFSNIWPNKAFKPTPESGAV